MRLLRAIWSALAAYAAGQLRVSLALSVLYGIGFAILRLPAWPLIAPLCGFLNLIPVFGAIISMILALGVMWLGGGTLYQIIAVLGVWVVVQGIEGFYLTPRILGRQLGMSPMLVFAGVLFGGAFFGPLGVLLAVPALAVALVVWRFTRSASGSSE
ncbi:MAG: AI-2E family transporter [Acidobacteria bacterium]|nr:AI-2E family transporter [Acidobacteriota bacterium]